MTEPREETAELAAVKEQFIRAETRLRELAQGAVELTRASVLLKKARMGLTDGAEGLRDLSERLSEYIESLAGLTQQLHAATETMQRSETGDKPSEIERRLGALQSSVGSLPRSDQSSEVGNAAELSAVLQRVDAVSEGLAQRAAEMESLATRLVDGAAAPVGLEHLALLPKLAENSDQVVRAVEAAGLDTLDAKLQSVVQRQLSSESPAAGAGSDGVTTAILERLEGSISQLSSIARMLREAPPDASRESLLAIEQRLEGLQTALTIFTRTPRITGAETVPGQLDLAPEVEDSLMALAQEMHAKEVAMVDMLAELRRSVGRDLDRRDKALGALLTQQSEEFQQSIDRVRAALWVLAVAVVAGAALFLAFSS
jgi:cell division septum initiation protein DivIVA